MSSEGIFHDACEVQTRNIPLQITEWYWVATFATRDLAEAYVGLAELAGRDRESAAAQEWQVVPV